MSDNGQLDDAGRFVESANRAGAGSLHSPRPRRLKDLETTRAEAAAIQASEPKLGPSAKTLLRMRRLRILLKPLFLICVGLPTVIAAVYYGLVASDVYVSESRFVVRSSQRPQLSGLGSILQGGGFSRSQDDTYSVHDFVLSRDALSELEQKLSIRAMYSAGTIDPVGRFTSLEWDHSFESFYKYYLRHVSIEYDAASAISVLTVRSYAAADAQRINALLLTMGERLVNQLNDRSRRDLISVAEKDVAASEDRAKAASLALSGFRSNQSVFDPERQATIQLQGVAKTQEELLATEAQLDQLRQVSPSNPQIATLQSRIVLLRRAASEQNARVSGRGGSSFSSQSSAYDRLLLEKTFSDRQLASSLATLETARNEAQRQQLYLERLVQPNLPDNAMEPRRIRIVAMVLIIGLIVWGVLGLVFASVREHTD